MSKHDAVDELMRMATRKAAPEMAPETASGATQETARKMASAREPGAGEVRDAKEVLEGKVTAGEPGLPPGLENSGVEASTTVIQARASGERGRALFQAMRPFLPAVGGALRRVPHPAGKVAADLLPWLGNIGTMVADRMGNRPAPGVPAVLPEMFSSGPAGAPEARVAQLAGQLKETAERLEAQGEQLRRMREALERTVAEQGTLAHQAHGLGDRVRLLTACVLILLMLVAAQIVLLAVYLHR